MARHWTFGQQIAAGFALMVVLALLLGGVAISSLHSVVAEKDAVLQVNAHLLAEAESLRAAFERKIATSRGFLLDRDEKHLKNMEEARRDFANILSAMEKLLPSEEGQRMATDLGRDEQAHNASLDRLISLRRGETSLESINQFFYQELLPKREALYQDLNAFVRRQEVLLAEETAAASQAANRAIGLMEGLVVLLGLVAVLSAFLLSRAISRQIGSAIGQMQSSSAELQAAANQQASGAREQATAMSEISTTITELLATSRQIADSAQRVAQVAGQTAGAARGGGVSVEKAQGLIDDIRRQIDQVVAHMLELGRKSQQIGSILEIVTELAEQTNILAINATIEAAGAGETGKRFGVVADEIRKLADRVAGSTKEIRALIDEVRSAVNTTVMATETGSKAVEAGSRQFAEVSAGFVAIAGLVTTTTEASREIELSTQQQTTAVEQVNVAVTNVAQATRENEASSAQTLETAGQLARLSKDLLQRVKAQAAH